MFAVGRSRLAWLIATCPSDDIRNEAKSSVKAHEQARLAVATLAGMIAEIDSGRLKLSEELRDKLRQDACYARKAEAMAWADLGQFDKARLVIETLQGDLDPSAKGWQADERIALDNLLQNHILKSTPYRAAAPLGTARPCPEK
jgi:hypothetical protein